MENCFGINTAGLLQLEIYSLLLISEPETKKETSRIEEACRIGPWVSKDDMTKRLSLAVHSARDAPCSWIEMHSHRVTADWFRVSSAIHRVTERHTQHVALCPVEEPVHPL